MPAWSEEVASEMLVRGLQLQIHLDQMQLQKLVYIAHGWQLVETGEPLTGDRPEVQSHGPEYRRLAELLAPYGARTLPAHALAWPNGALLEQDELDLVNQILDTHGQLSGMELSAITRAPEGPWAQARSDKIGKEISHEQVRQQFEAIAAAADQAADGPA